MSDEFRNFHCQGGFSSPFSDLPDAAADKINPPPVNPGEAREGARQRKAERTLLRDVRLALSVAERQEVGAALAGHLRQVLHDSFGGARAVVFPPAGQSRVSPTFDR